MTTPPARAPGTLTLDRILRAVKTMDAHAIPQDERAAEITPRQVDHLCAILEACLFESHAIVVQLTAARDRAVTSGQPVRRVVRYLGLWIDIVPETVP